MNNTIGKELLNNVLYDLDNHDSRLVYADWLEENGDLNQSVAWKYVAYKNPICFDTTCYWGLEGKIIWDHSCLINKDIFFCLGFQIPVDYKECLINCFPYCSKKDAIIDLVVAYIKYISFEKFNKERFI